MVFVAVWDRVTAADGATDRTVRGTLKVKVPLLGGKVVHDSGALKV